jgi:hypothetical protein
VELSASNVAVEYAYGEVCCFELQHVHICTAASHRQQNDASCLNISHRHVTLMLTPMYSDTVLDGLVLALGHLQLAASRDTLLTESP